MDIDPNVLIEAWRTVFKNEMKTEGKAWVLFKHGTIVLVENAASAEAATEEAKQCVAKNGPVYPGTPHGDFDNFDTPSVDGAVVTGHCDVMFNIVIPCILIERSNPIVVGLTGRALREEDSKNIVVIHVEMPNE